MNKRFFLRRIHGLALIWEGVNYFLWGKSFRYGKYKQSLPIITAGLIAKNIMMEK